MSKAEEEIPDRWDPVPRWPALIAIIAVAGLNFALPNELVAVPKWWFIAIVAILMLTAVIAHWKEYHWLDHMLGFGVSALITFGMIASVVLPLKLCLNGRKRRPSF
jgi:hypothetical protein